MLDLLIYESVPAAKDLKRGASKAQRKAAAASAHGGGRAVGFGARFSRSSGSAEPHVTLTHTAEIEGGEEGGAGGRGAAEQAVAVATMGHGKTDVINGVDVLWV